MKSTQSHLFTTTHWYNTCLMEALVFAVSGQTEGIIQLSLELLTSKVKSLIIERRIYS
ncbi:hypothetical protein NIES3787_12290 [Microcystis aeruginosa NIES-3787]|uniref:Uncharacterized protein n=1 Tax=Microcystis aeruginosa NIES-3787 TaxID=2517782 RepID=A0A6H9GGE8_MICAE|nr:hypothetical protein NIES3787_12290 [Microcystis aeruginosa NIES-3787]